MNADEVLQLIRAEARRLGSQQALARYAGVSSAFITQILKRKQPVPREGALMDYLGLKATVTVRWDRTSK